MTGHEDFPCDAAVSLAGPAGRLEALTACPPVCVHRTGREEDRAGAATAVICHPHSLHGGTLHNKVVHTLARAFGALGARTLRFNFRGVGKSEGAYDRGVGETEDLLAVLEWVCARRPQDALWLAGFSFGAYVALRAAARFPVARLVLVAPPVPLYDFAALAPRAPALIIQGEADEVVPAPAVREWAQGLQPAPQLVSLPGAGHFFHRRLNELYDIVLAHLAPHRPHA